MWNKFRISVQDNSKIVLTFTDEILASSVIADQFTVGRLNSGTTYDKVEIGSVTVSGKQIILTFKQPITDGLSKTFAVQVQDQTVNGITYQITTTEGDVVSLPSGNNKIKNPKKQQLLLHYSGSITSGSLMMDVYDAKGKKLDSYSVISNIGEEKENLMHNAGGGTTIPAGTYYLRVTKSRKSSTGIYSFSLSGK